MIDCFERIESLVEKVEDWSKLPASPLVSVWMITYNHEGVIRQALDSILMQRVDFPYEIVIGEDKSTDNTREIVLDYQRRHPDKIRLRLARENLYSQGLKPGTCGVLPACRGKYIAMCEGDDYWSDPLKLQKQVDFLESHPDYVITYHNAKTIDVNGNPIIYYGRNTDDTLKPSARADFSGDELKRGEQTIGTLTVCFRNVFKNLSYPEELYTVSNGDIALFSFLGNFGCGKYLGDVIAPAGNRIHAGGIWSMQSRQKQLTMLAKTYHQIMKFYRRTGDVEMAYYYREKEFNTLKALLGKGTKSGKRSDLVGPYGRYSLICLRHLCGTARLHAKVALRLILGVRL